VGTGRAHGLRLGLVTLPTVIALESRNQVRQRIDCSGFDWMSE
jgi:hypothetical protein